VLFVSAPLLGLARQATAGIASLRQIVVVGEAQDLPRFDQLLAAEKTGAEPVAASPDEVAFWLYSSGSTGMPKGVRHVHASAMETARLYAQNVLGIREDDVVYSAAKLFFAYGLGNALTFPMSVGATAVLFDGRPTPDAVFDLLRRERDGNIDRHLHEHVRGLRRLDHVQVGRYGLPWQPVASLQQYRSSD